MLQASHAAAPKQQGYRVLEEPSESTSRGWPSGPSMTGGRGGSFGRAAGGLAGVSGCEEARTETRALRERAAPAKGTTRDAQLTSDIFDRDSVDVPTGSQRHGVRHGVSVESWTNEEWGASSARSRVWKADREQQEQEQRPYLKPRRPQNAHIRSRPCPRANNE